MTHAALKDLLPCPCGNKNVQIHSGDSSGKRYVCCNDGDCHFSIGGYSDEQVRDRWNRRAALSAMEGEAVPAAWGHWAEGLPAGTRLMRYDGKPLVDHERSEYFNVPLYTAPPPQQAVVPALEVFRIAGGDVECCPNPTTAEALECLRDLRECYDESLATHPTPSPGPQGEVVVTTDEAGRCVLVSRQDEEHRILSVIWEVATPPAHQPGEVVTDEMVEAAWLAYERAAVADGFEGPDDSERRIAIPWMRAALAAALSTTPASGGEHG